MKRNLIIISNSMVSFKNLISLSLFALMFTFSLTGSAQAIYFNAITGEDPSEDNPFTSGQIVANGITVSGIGFGSGLENEGASNRYTLEDWPTGSSLNLNDYIYWRLTPNSCFEIDFTSLVFEYQRTGNGPQNIALRSSLDGYTTNIWSLSNVSVDAQTVTIPLTSPAFQNITSAITFRLYGWNAGNSGGAFSINSFLFNGQVNGITGFSAGTITGVSPICSGSSTVLSLSDYTGSVQWQSSTNNTTFTNIGGATSATYTTPVLSATRYYRAAVTQGTCTSFSNTFTVDVITTTGNNTTTISACDSYTWSVNGTTYTTSGTYTFVNGCQTETLQLTITPSTNITTTASACDAYTWSVNGTTYTTSGTYTFVNGCQTETLQLTITPSASNTTTASACDSYTWSVNGTTYTTSGTYTFVNGCQTETLELTITPSSSNTTIVNSCSTYTWAENGTTYTTSGTYTFVSGCRTEILELTISEIANNTTTASACDSYTWSVNGETYTQSGTYTFVDGCQTENLVLTITPSTSNTTTASACDTYTWSVDGNVYTTSGTYTAVVGCLTETLNLTVTASTVYFVDADGDGFGSATTANFCSAPSTGYSVNNTDCDDAVSTIYPGAPELCNDVDDNCNGFIDEGCPSTIDGEEPFNALEAPSTMYSFCNSFFGTLAGAFPSTLAQSSCVTGEDVWYKFTALTAGVTIFIGSNANDLVLELQDADGNLIEIENTVNGPGTEVLSTISLIPGNEYRFGIRNNNSNLHPGGQYSACVRHLRRGGSDSGTSATWPATLSTCSLFKAAFCGSTGVQYRYTWTGISGTGSGQVFTRTQTSDYLNVTAVTPALPAGSMYNVLVTAIYSIPNGANVIEVYELPALAPTTITINPVSNVALRTSDTNVNGPRFRGSVVAALPWVCGVTNWRWRFTEVNPLTLQTVGIPIEQNRGAASNFMNLNNVTALQFGKTYAVQSAPLFTYTGTNYQWGPVRYMSIIGNSGMITDGASEGVEKDASQDFLEGASQELEVSVYPNPSNGSDLNLSISGIESDNVQVIIYDALGRKVESNRYVVDGTLQTTLILENDLSNGLYILEATTEKMKQSIRFMVER